MASLREEMEKRGAQSDKQRLYLLAVESLQKSAVNPDRAFGAFRAALAQDCSLMIELLGGEDAVRTAAHGFLHSIAAEMKNQPPPKDQSHAATHTGGVPASAPTNTAAGNQSGSVTQSRTVPAAVAHGTDQSARVTQPVIVRPVREPSKAQREADLDAALASADAMSKTFPVRVLGDIDYADLRRSQCSRLIYAAGAEKVVGRCAKALFDRQAKLPEKDPRLGQITSHNIMMRIRDFAAYSSKHGIEYINDDQLLSQMEAWQRA